MDTNSMLYPTNKIFSIKRQVKNTSAFIDRKAFQIFQGTYTTCLMIEHICILFAEE